jgi:hypothetical protein
VSDSLLYLCLRARWEPSALEAARQEVTLQADVDWDVFLQEARREGVSPLLYDVACGQGLFPPPVEGALRLDYYATARRNALAVRQLEEALCCLDAAGVPVIVLKGAALAQAVYGNVALRPMADLDLLVHERDVPAALDALARVGYERPGAELRPGYLSTYCNQVTVTKVGGGGRPIEVHWHLIGYLYYQRAIGMDWFWQTARPFRVGDTVGRMLGHEAQVLHLCGHLLQHGAGEEARLLWLHDLAEVIACYGERIDWDLVLERARAYDLVLPVRYALARVEGDWRAPLPLAVSGRLRALRASPGEERVYALLHEANRPLQHFWGRLMTTSGWGARLRQASSSFFPSPSYMRQRYRIAHGFLIPFYYPYRWYRALRHIAG